MAARYVVDRSGIVRGADVNPDYTVRRDPEETLRVLEQQSKAGRVTR
jgi:alkyl hydroperoxide reductase subunit AhpC